MVLTEEQHQFLKQTRMHICIPCYGGQITEPCFKSVLRYMVQSTQLGLSIAIDTLVNESLVTRARNNLVAMMLAFDQNSTHLMFIDADIQFDPEEIIKLLLADKDIVGGLYPKKTLPIDYVVNTVPNAAREGDLVEVSNLGTGFMLIKREVIERMIMANPQWKFQDDIGLPTHLHPFMYALFDTEIDPVSRRYLSEDYLFCQRWRQMGGKIWADLSITLNHVGHFSFKGDANKLRGG